jgi:DNA-binding XRE family transcriptional regulator
MKSQAILQIESMQIGTAPQTAAVLDRAKVISAEFGVSSAKPMKGTVSLSEFMRAVEADTDIAPRLSKARQDLAKLLGDAGPLRRIRLEVGLSQQKLADAAGTTQTYVARLEAGTLDPGTDMLARLAQALRTDVFKLFSAVREQRELMGSRRGG